MAATEGARPHPNMEAFFRRDFRLGRYREATGPGEERKSVEHQQAMGLQPAAFERRYLKPEPGPWPRRNFPPRFALPVMARWQWRNSSGLRSKQSLAAAPAAPFPCAHSRSLPAESRTHSHENAAARKRKPATVQSPPARVPPLSRQSCALSSGSNSTTLLANQSLAGSATTNRQQREVRHCCW